MAVTDASFMTSLFHADDANHAAAWEWYDASGVRGEELVAPTILLTEVWAAFSRTLDLPDLGRSHLLSLTVHWPRPAC